MTHLPYTAANWETKLAFGYMVCWSLDPFSYLLILVLLVRTPVLALTILQFLVIDFLSTVTINSKILLLCHAK